MLEQSDDHDHEDTAMFTTLPATRAPRSRSLGGTIASLLLHGALIAGAIALTTTRRADARSSRPPLDKPPVWITTRDESGMRPRVRSREESRQSPWKTQSVHPMPRIPGLEALPDVVGPDLGATPGGTEPDLGTGLPAVGVTTAGGGAGIGGATVMGEAEVDRAPRVLGEAPQPRYPDALRSAGITGRVVVELVVDTLGRAEMGTVQVEDGTRAEFIESVRAALPRFRFTAGEAGGRRVRTRVRMPFAFTLR